MILFFCFRHFLLDLKFSHKTCGFCFLRFKGVAQHT